MGPKGSSKYSKVFQTAEEARSQGGTRREHRSTTSGLAVDGPCTASSETITGTGTISAQTELPETPNETMCQGILTSAEVAFKTACSKLSVTDEKIIDCHSNAIEDVISEFDKDWRQSLFPPERLKKCRFLAHGKLETTEYGVHIVPCFDKPTSESDLHDMFTRWEGNSIFATSRLKPDPESQKWVAAPSLLIGSKVEVDKAKHDFWERQPTVTPTQGSVPDLPSSFIPEDTLNAETEWDDLMR